MSKELQALEQLCEDVNKSLKAFEFIKELLNLKVIELGLNDSDTRLFVSCGDFKASILIPPPYIDLLKEIFNGRN